MQAILLHPRDHHQFSSIDQWGMTGRATDVIFKYFTREDFFREQPLYDGAVEFITELIKRGHEVIILTAIDPRFASIRAEKTRCKYCYCAYQQ